MKESDKRFNYVERRGNQLPSIYTNSEFIEFIRKWLIDQGKIPREVKLVSGNNIKIEESREGEFNVFKISYVRYVEPTYIITTSPSFVEIGTIIAPNSISIKGTISSGSELLKSIIWTDIVPELNILDASYVNDLTIDSLNKEESSDVATTVAEGYFVDSVDTRVNIRATITRPFRFFYGMSPSNNASDLDLSSEYINSSLGDLSRIVAFDPKYAGDMYRFIAIPSLHFKESHGLYENNVALHSPQFQHVNLNPNSSNSSFELQYTCIYASELSSVKSELHTQAN